MHWLGKFNLKKFNGKNDDIIPKRKHRVRRTLSEGEKRDMQQRIEIELENMAHLSRPYLTEVIRWKLDLFDKQMILF
jgi:hypothetical protein